MHSIHRSPPCLEVTISQRHMIQPRTPNHPAISHNYAYSKSSPYPTMYDQKTVTPLNAPFFSTSTKQAVAMPRDPNVPGFSGKGSPWDVSQRDAQNGSAGAFANHCRNVKPRYAEAAHDVTGSWAHGALMFWGAAGAVKSTVLPGLPEPHADERTQPDAEHQRAGAEQDIRGPARRSISRFLSHSDNWSV